jgi:hypothetical protein
MTRQDHLTRTDLIRDLASFPRADRHGQGVRPGTQIDLADVTGDGLWLVVRLPGWDHVDLFGDQDDASFELEVPVPWAAVGPGGLTVFEVAAAVRAGYGWDRYTAAFQL